jgi:FlaA1/EpsC-like NDP-sugar epimerase
MAMYKSVDQLLALSRTAKRLLALAVDAVLCAVTFWLAVCLRMESWVALSPTQWKAMACSLVIAIPLFIVFGLYRSIFRHAGWSVAVSVVKAVTIYGLLYSAVLLFMVWPGVPRTLGVRHATLLLIAMGISRGLAHYWLSGEYISRLNRGRLPKVLIYGAGNAGRQLAGAISNSDEMQVLGFLDDDSQLQGHKLLGLPIFNPIFLPELVKRHKISNVLLAIPSASRRRRNEILEITSKAHVSVRKLPGLMDLAQGRVQVTDLVELDVEDLLGRDVVPADQALLEKNVRAKVVMVTGAGGSIGGELCRQLFRCCPEKLLLVESSEFALYSIHQELTAVQSKLNSPITEILPLLANVQDEDRMRELMQTWRPTTVYHAAAYKHVPMVEHNPAEGVKNNVIGTWVVASAAVASEVSNFVLVSTDKAVRPTNIMGATKRMAEMVLQAMADVVAREGGKTCFSMVRFGNVLGSSGSVVPLFRNQIKSGGPITLTHAGITRYFMTIPEAAQLVIQAGAMAQGGEVFVLDMGEPVRIIDLARRMVELSGLTVRDSVNPTGDLEIEITGLRPGEKLYEELLIGDNPVRTSHQRILKAQESFLPWSQIEENLQLLNQALKCRDVVLIRGMLEKLVSGYQPTGEIVDWVFSEVSPR